MRGQFLLRVGAATLFWTLAIAFTSSAFAAGLKCVCTNCTYQSGRTEVPYTYDPNFNSTPAGRAQYNAAEAAAMKEADEEAGGAISEILLGGALPSCPAPCDPDSTWDSSHGPPFAGGTGGSGIARSLWKVTYSCFKKVVVPPPPPPPPPPPNGGINVVPGGQTTPVMPPVTTTCAGCQSWVVMIQNADRQIANAWDLFNKYPGMMDGRWQNLMQSLQTLRAELVEDLHKCERLCAQPTQNMTPPPQDTQPPPQNTLPFSFGIGGFGTGGGDSRGDDFKKGQDFKKKP